MTRTLLSILLAALLAGCGGGDHSPADRYLLTMETTAHQPEVLYVYATERDCIGAGSYRVAVYPDRYIGFACTEAP